MSAGRKVARISKLCFWIMEIMALPCLISMSQTTFAAENANTSNPEVLKSRQQMYSPVEKIEMAPVKITEDSFTSRKPASVNSDDDGLVCMAPEEMRYKLQTEFKLSRQIRATVLYYLEVREGKPVNVVSMYAAPSDKLKPIGELRSGDIVGVEDISKDYLEKLKADRSSETIWRKVTVKVDDDKTKDLWFKYNWKTMYTLSSVDQPFEMMMNSPKNMVFQPLYKDAGLWTPKDCQLDPTVCITKVETNSRVYLLETQIKKVDKFTNQEWYSLFYHLGVDTLNEKMERQQSHGWTYGYSAFRRIDQVPAYLFMTGGPRLEDFLPDDEKQRNESRLFVMSKNGKDPKRSQRMIASLGISENKMSGLSSIFDLTLQYDFHSGVHHMELEQSFVSSKYTQEAIQLGGSISSKLFADVEMRGDLDISTTVTSNNPSIGTSYYVDAQQWFVYSTPWNLNDSAIRLGVGAYYMSMISNQDVGGFRGFVSPHSLLSIDGENMALGFRYAPVGQDFSLKLENRLIGVRGTYRLPWKRGKRQVQLVGDYTDLFFKSQATNSETKLQTLGVMLSFPFEF